MFKGICKHKPEVHTEKTKKKISEAMKGKNKLV